MIFVTVGNDYRSFDRLLKKIDEIAPRLPREMAIQRGYTKYRPQNVKYFDFVSFDEAIQYLHKSQLVVSHAGIGTIILCKKYGIPTLIIPRRKTYGEHINDHQLEIAKVLENREEENIYVVYDEDELERKILTVLERIAKSNPTENMGRKNLIKTIKEFIERDE